MAQGFTKNEPAGSSPKAVAKAVERALTERNPRTRYPAGKDSLKLALPARWLREKLLDLAILKKVGLPIWFGGALQ
jgi:hypothetical protein